MLLGFEANNLQDAGAGDVRHHVGHALPNAQQSAAQHVVLAEAHALEALLAFLHLLAFAVTAERPRGPLRTSNPNSLLTYFKPQMDKHHLTLA